MSQHFKAHLSNIMPVAATAGPVNRWSFVDFFDKVLIAQATVAPHFWPGAGMARPVPGLPDDSAWDGVEVIGGHPVLWRGNELLVGATNDYTTWIPVGTTASTARAPILDAFVQPDVGSTTDWIRLDDPDDTFVVGQFARIDLDSADPEIATFNFYTVEAATDQQGSETSHADWSVSYSPGETGYLVTELFSEFASEGFLAIDGRVTELNILGRSSGVSFASAIMADAPVPTVGQTTSIVLEDTPTLEVGDVVSISTVSGAMYRDMYEVTAITGVQILVKRLALGTDQKTSGVFTAASPVTYVVKAPWIKVENLGETTVIVPAGASIGGTFAVKLKNLGYTGSVPPGTMIPSGSILDSVVANSAAYLVNAGSEINGDIYAVTALGEYGYILKERSIQSLQVIDAPGVPFAIRLEVPGLGPIAKNAWCPLYVEQTVQGLFFVGKDDLFMYAGGQVVQPVGRVHSQQFFQELDRARADEIVCRQFPNLRQVWVVYPQLKSVTKRVLIYNTEDNSIVLDDYSEMLGGLSGLGQVDWEIAPTWNDLTSSQIWSTETLRWFEYSEEGEQQRTLVGVKGDLPNIELGEDPTARIPRILLHGRVYYRLSAADCLPPGQGGYRCIAETHDYDFGAEANFKYTDGVELAIDTGGVDPGVPSRLWAQLGGRSNLDDELRWTDAVPISTRGGRNLVTKVALRMSGRYIRLRLYSDDPGAKWRVSRWTILARLGGTY